MAQTPEQLQAARELARQYGLTGADFYQHKQSKSFLISRTGIEKIQYKAGIVVGFEAVKVEPTFAAVKASATRKVKPEGAKTSSTLAIETFGSACPQNCQVSYFLEMAEKRALSRAVLKLSDFYQLGVYGEDEMPPEERPKAEETPAAAPAEEPKKPAAEASAPASAPPAASTTAAPKAGLNVELEAALQAIIRELASHHITPIERNKMMMGLNKLTLEQAQKSLANLSDTIDYRTSPEALNKARLDLRAFANANASALGQQEYNRLHVRAGALTVTAVDLIQEAQEAKQRLEMPQHAAA